MTNGSGKSDRPTIPGKSPNNAGQPVAEGMEGKGLAKGKRMACEIHRAPDRPDRAPSSLSSSAVRCTARPALGAVCGPVGTRTKTQESPFRRRDAPKRKCIAAFGE